MFDLTLNEKSAVMISDPLSDLENLEEETFAKSQSSIFIQSNPSLNRNASG